MPIEERKKDRTRKPIEEKKIVRKEHGSNLAKERTKEIYKKTRKRDSNEERK